MLQPLRRLAFPIFLVSTSLALRSGKAGTSSTALGENKDARDPSLTFYEALGVMIGAILTDNDREFCGIQERHPYELLLAMEDTEHRTTKISSPH